MSKSREPDQTQNTISETLAQVSHGIKDEHVHSAGAALDAMENPAAIALDRSEVKRKAHPCKQVSNPYRSPSWLASALDSDGVKTVATIVDEDRREIERWAHAYGLIDEPRLEKKAALVGRDVR